MAAPPYAGPLGGAGFAAMAYRRVTVQLAEK